MLQGTLAQYSDRLTQALLEVSLRIPIDDPQVERRLKRAHDDILQGYGYSITLTGDGYYSIEKASTSLLDDSSRSYEVTLTACTCPDFPTARGGLCKHRIAVLILEEMQK